MKLLTYFFYKLMEIFPFIPVFAATQKENAINGAIDRITYCLNYMDTMCTDAVSIFGATDAEKAMASSASLMGKVTTTMSMFTGKLIPISAGIGMAIAVLCWVIDIGELAIADRLTFETLIKSFAKVGLAIVLCGAATDIVDGIDAFGAGFTTDVGTNITGGTPLSPDYTALKKAFSDNLTLGAMDFLTITVESIVFTFPVYIMTGIMQLCMYIISFSRLVELKVRASFIGIPFGLLADDGWKGAGGRYIKKYVAIVCQGAVLIVIAKIYGSVCNAAIIASIEEIANNAAGGGDVFHHFFEGCMLTIGAGLATIALMFKSIGIVNDVFGA